jgi:hypothetical protein
METIDEKKGVEKGNFIKAALSKLRDADENKGRLPAHKIELSAKDKAKKRNPKHKKKICGDDY